MPRTLEALQAEVLGLPPADRARLLDSLISSFDADAGAEAAWDELADKREHELRAASVDAIPIDAAIARLEARFPA